MPEGENPEEDVILELRVKGVGDLLRSAHKELLMRLLAKLQAGTASHQELAILRNLLRDNGMILSPQSAEQQEQDAKRPPADLPDLDHPDYE